MPFLVSAAQWGTPARAGLPACLPARNRLPACLPTCLPVFACGSLRLAAPSAHASWLPHPHAAAGFSSVTFYALCCVVGSVVYRAVQAVQAPEYRWSDVKSFQPPLAMLDALPILAFGFQARRAGSIGWPKKGGGEGNARFQLLHRRWHGTPLSL